ncbi:hypothetical protein D0469_13475 [Peribacillus saganii]|uniref:Uncharacterized protein n=1 Tax=Peribacillus saganii TaxID=2303992 RepID=A0A372LLR5_9BACI|nr:hypothetical protein [Peribacillus saganii]RFU67924.1 hypothetical protein D0469_13475 [Peribacillus saganii]
MEKKSLRAIIVIGVNEGYGENEETDPLQMAVQAWQEVAEELYGKKGIYVSAIAHKSKAVYRREWGCPAGGEDTVTFTASTNPEYNSDVEVWKEAVENITKKMKDLLKQDTVTLEFEETKMVFFD